MRKGIAGKSVQMNVGPPLLVSSSAWVAFQSSPIFSLPRARLECSVFRFMRPLGVLRALNIMEGSGEKRPKPRGAGNFGSTSVRAAQMRIVSAGTFWPSRRGLSRYLKYIIRAWILALLWQIFTHAAARQISIFGSVDIAVEAVEPRAREWRDVRRAELAGAVGR